MSQENSQREIAAREHIIAVYGTAGDEFGATLFVAHHLDELDASYWFEHTGESKPDPQQVLQLLELRLDPEEDEIDILDFTLPGAVTNYVICVEFDESGNIAGVSMES
ncbi:MAG: DUF2004 domain-containing protein [Pseudomonadota bacterium]